MLVSAIHSCERYTASHGVTLEDLIARLAVVLELNNQLHKAGCDIWKDDGLYKCEVLPGIAVYQLLYEGDHGIDRDMKLSFRLAIDASISKALPDLNGTKTLGKLGPWSEDTVNSINDFGAWVSLLRENLKVYHGNAAGFFSACLEAFPDFIFSEEFPECFNTFTGNLNDFISEIVSALISLADDMPECTDQMNTKECLKAFSAKSGYKTSMEGNLDRKKGLTFNFTGKQGLLRILCEPHIKLHRSARLGDTEYYFHRIYFSTSNHVEFNKRTLIGYIGRHL